MPELPEVETIRQDLKKVLLTKTIKTVTVNKEKLVRNKLIVFTKTLQKNKIVDIDRIGKLLIFILAQKGFLLVHLKMTGQLIFQGLGKTVAGGHNLPLNLGQLPNKYTHIIFIFTDKSRLFFNDLRQFGFMQIVNKQELAEIKTKYGLDPLSSNFNEVTFKNMVLASKKPIKTLLLDQKYIAGIGNIYADEILFDAKIHPFKKSNALSPQEIKRMVFATKKILRQALKYKGTTFKDFLRANGDKGNYTRFLKVYQREKQPCLVCGQTTIKKYKIAGRNGRYCPVCQK